MCKSPEKPILEFKAGNEARAAHYYLAVPSRVEPAWRVLLSSFDVVILANGTDCSVTGWFNAGFGTWVGRWTRRALLGLTTLTGQLLGYSGCLATSEATCFSMNTGQTCCRRLEGQLVESIVMSVSWHDLIMQVIIHGASRTYDRLHQDCRPRPVHAMIGDCCITGIK